MKKLGLIVIMAITMVFVIQAADDAKGQIQFEDTVYDFGNIREDGGPAVHEFSFTNTGDAPLVITSARAECGCTKPTYPKKEILPGETEVIKVTYNPAGRPGGFTKSVTVRSNGTPAKVTLKIRGTVLPK